MACLSNTSTLSQSSLLLPSISIRATARWRHPPPPLSSSIISFSRSKNGSGVGLIHSTTHRSHVIARVSAESEAVKEENQLQLDIGGGGGDGFGSRGGEGGKGGGGGGGDDNGNSDESEEEGSNDNDSSKKKMAMSMSQKLTLGYAALIGVGGVMGYVKSGSQKSLAAGVLSTLLLYYVYTELPTRPAVASSLGLGLSAVLLGVMGSRFKKSGKIFPAGVVSFVSFVMAGGYLHGILRSLHT